MRWNWMVSVVVVKLMMIEHGNLQLQAAGKHCKLYSKDLSFSTIMCVCFPVCVSWPHHTISHVSSFSPIFTTILILLISYTPHTFLYLSLSLLRLIRQSAAAAPTEPPP
ncbi:hypothetical protein L1987_39226 [Smallanthus sonchifolius]|uniref:Uncharacterized protein n=1 Tax=Smallanthus sonchifolius TaxID=185202 RepID=A0ACB9HM44_9ASTR|nr:hypothetical protein L1987_39226 [Smallanthus sonchifolius]